MDILIDSTITDVTVYPDRARVTRSGGHELTTGLHRLLFADLPLTLDQDSVRVAGEGQAQVRILSVDVASTFFRDAPSAKVRELEEQIEAAEQELGELNDQEATLQKQMQYLSGLWSATEEYARGLSRGRSSVEDQANLVGYLREQEAATTAAKRELTQSKQPLVNQLTKLRQELKQLQSARPKQRYQAAVEVEVLSDGNFKPTLTYMVNQAGWQPLYDVRLQEDNAVLSLSYIAQVTQNSGEDWTAVSLMVSTARPALNQRLPELNPWYVDVYRPPQPRLMRARAAAAPMMQKMEMADEAEEMAADVVAPAPMEAMAFMAAEVATAAVESSGTAVTFRVGGSSDIPSDGSPHKTTVAHYSLKPDIDYLAIPKHTDAVFRRVTVQNESASPWLAGEVNLFVEDEYIGHNMMVYTAVGGELELLLGVEERITVGRELVKREVDKRFLSDKRRLRYGYEITIENLLNSKVKVVLQDHIPVSRHEDIKITLQESNVKPTEQTDLNLLKWELTLDGKTKQLVRYEYLVEYPRQLQVTGLTD